MVCPNCKKETDDLLYTKDCHGIIMRKVCIGCYNRIMAKGYDGVGYEDTDDLEDLSDLADD